MHAIRGIDLQLDPVLFLGHLVDGGRAKILAGIPIFHDALGRTDIQIVHDQMARLILFMPGPGVIYVGQPVEG